MYRRTLLRALPCSLLAGCAGVPFDGSSGAGRTPVHFGNESDVPYRFELSIATIGPTVTVRRGGTESRTFELTLSAFGSRSIPGDTITAVELPDSATPYGTYTLDPGETRRPAVRAVRQDETLLVLVTNAATGTIQAFYGFHCRPVAFTDVTVVVENSDRYGTYWSSSCGG